jgi:dCMP deaminase
MRHQSANKTTELRAHEDFIFLAERVAERSNCVRRSVGAVIVRGDQVIAEGWNGVSSEYENCRMAGCPRCTNGGETGSGYENCICIHAEQKAIADAAKRGVLVQGAIMYVNLRPCLQCLAICWASGIGEIYFSGERWEYPPETEKIYRILAKQFDAFERIEFTETRGLPRASEA